MKKSHQSKHSIIPSQKEGSETGAEDKTVTDTLNDAKDLFNQAKKRLLDINSWDKFSGPASATFCLIDANGKEVSREPKVGDFIRIDLPGPGTSEGKGYDWVIIEAIDDKSLSEKDEEYFAIRCRPSPPPGSTKETIAHFYTDSASSTFILERKGNIVSAAEKGRNEIINNKNVNVADKVRNTVVASSAMNGMAYPQWKTLMKGILGK